MSAPAPEPSFRATFEQAAVGIAHVARDGRWLAVNPALAGMIGWSREELLERTLDEVTHPADRGYDRAAVGRLWAGDDDVWTGERRFVAADGRVVRVALSASLVRSPEDDRPLHAVVVFEDVTERRQVERRLREQAHTLETLNRVNASLTAELDLETVVQRVTDAGRELTGARFGAFFYNVVDERRGEAYTLYTLSGVPRSAFERFPMPRNTHLFGPTFRGDGVIRIDDVREDPRYGKNPPYHGMPKGHLPVRSYLAAPVVSASGEVLGGLFFGHEDTGVFTAESERLIVGIAAQAAVAIDNAHLYRRVTESENRFRALAETVPDVVFLAGQDLGWTYVNQRFTALTGIPAEAARGDGWMAALHPEDRQATKARLAGAAADGRRLEVEFRLRSADGGYRWFVGRAVPVVTGDERAWFGSATDIDDLKRAQETLAEQARRLVDADRRKDDFLAVLGHELRNPLAAIDAGLRRLDAEGGNGDPIRTRRMMGQQVRQLATLLDDLLDVTRITRGKIELRREPVTVAEVVERAVDSSRSLVEERRHEIETTLTDPEVRVLADPGRLEQVVVNLLTNAARYTEPGGRIRIAVERRGEEARIVVSDTGIGLSREDLERIFEPFSQVRPAGGEGGGLGVGLTLVRRLVELHEGRVLVASGGLGEGSEFTVVLPVLTAEAARAVDDRAAEQAARDERDEGRAAADEATALSGLRVLLVDDNVDATEGLAALLELRGANVQSVDRGLPALDLARSFRPHAAVLDVGLPDVSGYELAQAFRRDAELAPTLLVALTGFGHEDARRRTRDSGFDHHLIKPVDLDTLTGLLAGARTTVI